MSADGPQLPTTILFDLDHTLLDSDTSMAEAYLRSVAVAGIDDPESHRSEFERINAELWRAVERGEIGANDVRVRRFETLLTQLGRQGEAARLAPEMADAFVAGLIEHGELFPGVDELLDALGDRPVGLVTNGIGMVQRGRLARLGLAERFDVVAISGELGMAKPGRAIFDHAFDELGDPVRGDAVMVGDNWNSDVVGAVNAGVPAIWFNPGAADRPSDESVSGAVAPVVEVGSIAELRSRLID